MTATDIIKQLHMLPHPEGGFYVEIYRAEETTETSFGQKRNVCTAIHFLLQGNEKSHLHRIKSDELWFFHLGEPLLISYIRDGVVATVTLGLDLNKGELLFAKIPANTWFCSRLKNGQGFGLVSCTVAPGFDFKDFELASATELLKAFPHLQEFIKEYTLAT